MKARCSAVPLAAILFAICLPGLPRASADPDFGDGSSATLTQKAWVALGAKNWADTIAYTSKCITAFNKLALDQEKNLASGHPQGEKTSWARDDVGACYYIRGKAYEGAGKISEAMADYKYLIDNLPLAQCRDPQGFSWTPAKPAKEALALLSLDHAMPDVITKIDLDSITVKTAAAVTTYRITGATKIQFKGQPASLTSIKVGMAVTVTPSSNATVADTINADDPPRKP